MLRSQIVEAVEALRQRKCRPEREAIAHYVLRKWGVPFQEVFSELENIVDKGDLVKVEYKGSTSYRSLEAFDVKSSPLLTKHSKILNSCKTSRFIITAVSELLSENEAYTREGIPPEELKARLTVYDPLRFTPDTLPIYLGREINVGTLVEGPEKRIYPKDIAIPSDILKAPEKKMRGRKSNATKEKEAALAAAAAAESSSKEEVVFAVKSVPPVPEPSKPVRAYGRKPAAEKAEKKLLVLVNHGDDEPELEAEADAETETEVSEADNSIEEKKPVPSKPEETPTGRSVRNKRKKEVFDPSDIVPKKRQTLTPVVKEKPSPQPAKLKSPAVPTPPPKKPGRKKKVEQVFEEDTTQLCEHCKRHKNIKGAIEEFLVCSDCNVTYHPSCLDYSKEQAAHVMERGTWQCSECKACQVCQGQCSEGPDTILCTSCYTGFHFKCLKLSPKTTTSSWLCPGCTDSGENGNIKEDEKLLETETKEEKAEAESETKQEEVLEKTDHPPVPEPEPAPEIKETEVKAAAAAVEPPVPVVEPEPEPEPPKKKAGRPPKKRIITLTLKPEPEVKKEPVPPSAPVPTPKEELDSKEDDIPADSSKWTPSHVEAYFKKHGLKEEGILFREQEIDGSALLLMRRQDIVQGMKLLLGPALKVYRLVVELQKNSRISE